MSQKKKTVDSSLLTIAVIGSLVFANVIGAAVYLGRLDLTKDGQYTLSDATKDTLRQLHDPITIRAYFTKELPPQLAPITRYVQDLLEEYAAHSGGYVRYEFVDPSVVTDEDKEKQKEVKVDIFGRQVTEPTAMERELESLGIPPMRVQVNQKDELQVKLVYVGMAIKYGDKTEVIPVVKETAGLEYDLTSLIRKLTRTKTPKLAFVTGSGSLEPEKDLKKLWSQLQQMYEITTVDLTGGAQIGEDVDAIIVLGPKQPFSEEAKKAIDAFVVSGKSAAFLLDAVRPVLESMTTEDAAHGMSDMLATYGINIGEGLVLDVDCATISVAQQRGWMQIQQPVKYPYMPLAKALDAQHPLTRGLAEVALPFMSPLTLAVAEGAGVKGEVLVKSSKEAWLSKQPYNLDPFQRWTKDMVGEQKEHNLLVALSGAIKSHFGAAAPAPAEGEEPSSSDSRLLVVGGTSLIADQFLSPSNMALAMNLVDWLLLDEALLAVRSRGLAAAPLDDLGDNTRQIVKYANIAGVPFAFVAFGIVRWRRREARRALITL